MPDEEKPGAPKQGQGMVRQADHKDFSKMAKAEKQTYLTRVFEKFDKDRSGSIDVEELYRALKFMDVPCSRTVCNALIADMDEDKSGTIDLDEFVQFFERLKTFESMKEAVAKKAEVTAVKAKVMSVYLVSILIFSFTVTLSYVTDPNPSAEMLVLFVVAIGLLVISMFGIIIVPYTKLIHAKRTAPEQPDEWGNFKKKKKKRAGEDDNKIKAGDDRVHVVVDAAPLDDMPPPADLPEAFVETWRLKKAELGELEDGTRLALPRGVANVLGADTLAVEGPGLPNTVGGSMMLEDASLAGSSKLSRSRTGKSRTGSAHPPPQEQRVALGMSAPVLPPGSRSEQVLVQGVTVTTLEKDEWTGDRFRSPVNLGQDLSKGKKRAPHFNVWCQKGAPVY